MPFPRPRPTVDTGPASECGETKEGVWDDVLSPVSRRGEGTGPASGCGVTKDEVRGWRQRSYGGDDGRGAG